MISASAMINTRVIIAQNGKNSDIENRFKQKMNRMKGFQKKISEDRKKNIIQIAKDIDDLVKSEISKTRSLIDDHVDFFQQEWENDKEDCDITNPLLPCDDIPAGETTELVDEDYFE